MKLSLLCPALCLVASLQPSFSQDAASRPFDHHNMPIESDPFTSPSIVPRLEQVPGACYEPEPPLSDEASLQRLGLTVGQEYSRYFDDAQAYLVCLERTKFDYVDIVRQHGKDYSEKLQR